jgi:DNA mismatch endonuclease (patch repair protein)
MPPRDLPPAPAPSSSAVRAVMRGNRGADTGPEKALRSALHRRGLRFRKHIRPEPGLRCLADLVFARERVAVFVDGCYWHGCPQHGREPVAHNAYWSAKLRLNRERDERNNGTLRQAGWTVIRAWEHEPVDEVAAKVWAALAKARTATPVCHRSAGPRRTARGSGSAAAAIR